MRLLSLCSFGWIGSSQSTLYHLKLKWQFYLSGWPQKLRGNLATSVGVALESSMTTKALLIYRTSVWSSLLRLGIKDFVNAVGHGPKRNPSICLQSRKAGYWPNVQCSAVRELRRGGVIVCFEKIHCRSAVWLGLQFQFPRSYGICPWNEQAFFTPV